MPNTSTTLLTLRIPAFEAAIRKALDSRLNARPVVIVTAFKQLGRVVAACPLARAHGVEEETHFPTARMRCPDAAFFLPDKRLADRAMRALLARAGKYSPLVEPAGGGCVLLDIRGTERLWGDNRSAAERLRRDVVDGMRLPAAAGLATCRPWSRLASRAAGDDGVCRVPPGSEDAFLDGVPIAWVGGLKPRTRTLLMEMNLRSLGQLRPFDRGELGRQFGRDCGDTLWNVLHPPEWDAVALLRENAVLDMDANRIRVEAALAEPTAALESLRIVARTLAARIAAALRARDLGAARLRLTLIHDDGALKTAEARTGGFVQEESALLAAAERLLTKALVRRVRVFRVWLLAEKLAEPERQGSLFGPAAADPPLARGEETQLLKAVDGIRKRYGDEAVRSAALLAHGRKRKAEPERLPFTPHEAATWSGA